VRQSLARNQYAKNKSDHPGQLKQLFCTLFRWIIVHTHMAIRRVGKFGGKLKKALE